MGLTDSSEMGFDASGIVKRVGAAVKLVQPGDRVATLCNGALRSLLRTNASLVVRLPDNMSLEEGASLPAAYVIAYHGLCEVGRLVQGETVLIHSATGGTTYSTRNPSDYTNRKHYCDLVTDIFTRYWPGCCSDS